MKKPLAAASLICLLVVSAFAAALPNYSGTWVWNKEKSEGVPQLMANMEKLEMIVAQTDKQFSVKTAGASTQEIVYNIDGTKGKAQMGGRMPGEATVYLEKKDDGKLVLHADRELYFQGTAVAITTTETWELSDGGKTLTVARTIDSPRGAMSMKLVFTLRS